MTNSILSTGCCDQETIGADPLYFKWNVVRGDTSSLTFQFLMNDEVTELDMSDWTFVATAFNNKNQTSYDLDVSVTGGNVEVTATAGDSYEIFWSSPNSSAVKVESLTGLTGTKPDVPSMIVTVNQVD